MTIIGRDHEPPLFTGSGRIRMDSPESMGFDMHGEATDADRAMAYLRQASDNPYNTLAQVRLTAKDYEGNKWNAGWTVVTATASQDGVWQLSGPLEGMSTGVSGLFVATDSGVEAIYEDHLRLPMTDCSQTTVVRNGRTVLESSEQTGATVEVLGTRVELSFDSLRPITWAVAATSEEFTHPCAENQIGEPLRILLGQLVFPRMVARNYGNSEAVVWLRRAGRVSTNTLAASILEEDPALARESFWPLYGDILSMIVRRNNAHGPSMDAHPLTQIYHELIESSASTNWIWCLTLASAIEGVVNLLAPKADRAAAYSREELAALAAHVRTWPGNKALVSRIIGSVAHAGLIGTEQAMKRYKSSTLITQRHIDAWKTVRNQVAHGTLVSPWSEAKLDEQMHLLCQLFHRLSVAYIEQQNAGKVQG